MSQASNPLLSTEELTFFKQYGYLIKRSALSADHCETLLDLMWTSAPKGIERDRPDTWGPIPETAHSSDATYVVSRNKWQYRSISTHPSVLRTMTAAPMWNWAEQLLGQSNVRPPTEHGLPMGHAGPAWPGGPVDPQLTEGARGIYATLPDTETASLPDQLHTDGHPFHFGAVCLLEDCPPDSGAFKVWPGSHRQFYPLFPMQYDQARIPFYEHLPSHKGIIHPEAYLDAVKAVESSIQPVDCWGSQGDVVLWHHRLGHMAGYHRGTEASIRQALLDRRATSCFGITGWVIWRAITEVQRPPSDKHSCLTTTMWISTSKGSTHPRRICGGIGVMRSTLPTPTSPRNFWRTKAFIRRAPGSRHSSILNCQEKTPISRLFEHPD